MSYWTLFLQPSVQKAGKLCFKIVSLAHRLHNANFDWQWPVSHCCLHMWCQHATALHIGRILWVSKSCVKLSLWQDITDWPSGTHPTFFLHRHSGQGIIRLTINHHEVARLRICAAWLFSIKGHVQIQFPLVSLWKRHMLTVLLTMQQRFHILWTMQCDILAD
jgi:hypothetical protein